MSQSGAWREGISLSAQRQLWWPCSVCQDVMPACEGQRQPFLQAPWCNTKCLGFMSSSRCSRIGQCKDLKNPQPPDKNSFSYALPPTCSSSACWLTPACLEYTCLLCRSGGCCAEITAASRVLPLQKLAWLRWQDSYTTTQLYALCKTHPTGRAIILALQPQV